MGEGLKIGVPVVGYGYEGMFDGVEGLGSPSKRTLRCTPCVRGRGGKCMRELFYGLISIGKAIQNLLMVLKNNA